MEFYHLCISSYWKLGNNQQLRNKKEGCFIKEQMLSFNVKIQCMTLTIKYSLHWWGKAISESIEIVSYKIQLFLYIGMHYLRIARFSFLRWHMKFFNQILIFFLIFFPIHDNICDTKLLRNRREIEAHDRTCHLHLRI